VSDTPMARREAELGLSHLSLSEGGWVVRVFQTGASALIGDADRDPIERRDIVERLGVRSEILVPLQVDAARRGVLGATSAQPDRFGAEDLRFLQAVARWVGLVAQ